MAPSLPAARRPEDGLAALTELAPQGVSSGAGAESALRPWDRTTLWGQDSHLHIHLGRGVRHLLGRGWEGWGWEGRGLECWDQPSHRSQD